MRNFIYLMVLTFSFPSLAQKINVSAEITYFQKNASYTDFADGSSEVAHVSRYKLLSPEKYKGKEVSFLHWIKRPEIENKLILKANVEFEISENLLSKNQDGTSTQLGFSIIADTFKVVHN